MYLLLEGKVAEEDGVLAKMTLEIGSGEPAEQKGHVNLST